MPVKITEDQYQELLDVMTELRPADVVRTFENITGIVVKPYTGYQFFDVADNYLGDYGIDTIMQILNNAGIEVVHE